VERCFKVRELHQESYHARNIEKVQGELKKIQLQKKEIIDKARAQIDKFKPYLDSKINQLKEKIKVTDVGPAKTSLLQEKRLLETKKVSLEGLSAGSTVVELDRWLKGDTETVLDELDAKFWTHH